MVVLFYIINILYISFQNYAYKIELLWQQII